MRLYLDFIKGHTCKVGKEIDIEGKKRKITAIYEVFIVGWHCGVIRAWVELED